MEDPSVEWEILNYSPSSLQDDETDQKTTKLGWILNTGLSLGKKLVITGVVISSVNLVLPPLVVVSALGFALSVPFGVVFVSYACTEKLMSKLLPSQAGLSLMLEEYQTVLPHHEDEELDVVAIEKLEEREQREAMKDALEMRIDELVDDDDDDSGLRDGIRYEQESGDHKFMNKVGYLDVHEGKDDEFLDNAKVGGVNKEEVLMKEHLLEPKKDYEKPSFFNVVGVDTGIGRNATKTDDYAVGAPQLRNTGDKKYEGQSNVGRSGKDVEFTVPILQVHPNFVENDDQNNVTCMEERENFLEENKNEKEEKTVPGIKGTDKNKKRQTVSKGKSSSKEMERRGKKKTLAALRLPRKRKLEPEGDKRHEKLSGKEKELLVETKTSYENNLNFSPVTGGKFGLGENLCAQVVAQETKKDELGSISSEKEQAGEQECIMLGSEDLDNKQMLAKSNHTVLLNDDAGNIDGSLEKEQKPMDLKEMPDGQSVEDGAVFDVSNQMNDETNTSPGVLATETAEGELANDSGINKKIEPRTVMVYNDRGENYHRQSRMIAYDGEYHLEVSASTGMRELKHDEEIPKLKEEEDPLHSDEGQFHDEKIRKKIDAIRVIVGFTAPQHPSYFEELKALYFFTGIEPPSPSRDPSDLAEFYNKLSFLMSVIGLK